MFSNKNEPIFIPVYINLETEVIIYHDIINNCFSWDRISDSSQNKGLIKKTNGKN
jgi:hypothetical protein